MLSFFNPFQPFNVLDHFARNFQPNLPHQSIQLKNLRYRVLKARTDEDDNGLQKELKETIRESKRQRREFTKEQMIHYPCLKDLNIYWKGLLVVAAWTGAAHQPISPFPVQSLFRHPIDQLGTKFD